MTSPSPAKTADRRGAHERRRRKLRALFVGSLGGRRRGVRRREPGGIAAVDWYPARCFALVFITLLLSCVDSINTLALLSRGFIEVNPLMRTLIDAGGASFALIKLGLTAASLTALVILTRAKTFGRLLAPSTVLYASVAVYVGLVSYEFWLLDGLPLLDY